MLRSWYFSRSFAPLPLPTPKITAKRTFSPGCSTNCLCSAPQWL
ncbi:Uncharacterised protein [Vibrio cholerae]|nr:Uncharacterised protein [Vibrio cholerae]